MLQTKRYGTCVLCEALCGIEVEVRGADIVSIRGNPNDPLSQGYICPKAVALGELQRDPDRLKTPLRRVGNEWQPIEWSAAFDLVARRLDELRREHGSQAVAMYAGNPTVHSVGALLYGQIFSRALRSHNRFSATSVDQLPQMLAAFKMFGHQLLMPIPDVDRTRFMLILGANPLASNGSLMTAPNMRKRLKAIQARGGRVVVVDPRRTPTAKLADEHFFVRPGSDVLLLLAMLEALSEGFDSGHLSDRVRGLDTLKTLVKDFPAERVADQVGMTATEIRELAAAFADASGAVCYGRMGLSTTSFGALCQWLINALNLVTGNLDKPGGAMFTQPAADLAVLTRGFGRGSFNRFSSRVRGLPEFAGELPAASLAEEITTPGEGQVRGLVTLAGNPVLSTPNGTQLDRALPGLEFMVSIDFYLNETTRHADIILPPTAPLEREHYDLVFHALAVRNTAKFIPAMVPKGPEQRHDWQILAELSRRLGGMPLTGKRRLDRGLNRLLGPVLSRLGPMPLIDLALRKGPYKGMSLRKLRREPHGVDLGPLATCLEQRLQTADGTIELAPDVYTKDMARLEQYFFGSEAVEPTNGHLRLISRRLLRSNNSWMHNCKGLVSGKAQCTLLMHPSDADQRGLRDGAMVAVRSKVGAVTAPLVVSDEMMPGVVSLPHGFGHVREGVRLRVAQAHPGVSINDLTDDKQLDGLAGTAALAVDVEVEAVGADPVPPAQ